MEQFAAACSRMTFPSVRDPYAEILNLNPYQTHTAEEIDETSKKSKQGKKAKQQWSVLKKLKSQGTIDWECVLSDLRKLDRSDSESKNPVVDETEAERLLLRNLIEYVRASILNKSFGVLRSALPPLTVKFNCGLLHNNKDKAELLQMAAHYIDFLKEVNYVNSSFCRSRAHNADWETANSSVLVVLQTKLNHFVLFVNNNLSFSLTSRD